MVSLASINAFAKAMGVDRRIPFIYDLIFRTGDNYNKYTKRNSQRVSFSLFLYILYLDIWYGKRFARDDNTRRRVFEKIRKRIQLFDAHIYIASHEALARAVPDDHSGWRHFAGTGWKEERIISKRFQLVGFDQSRRKPSDFIGRLFPVDAGALQKHISRPHGYSPRQYQLGSQIPHMVRMVDLIMPVYGNFRLTRIAVDSVLAAKNDTRFQLHILNDCSPEPEITEYLRSVAATHDNVSLIENPQNLGFVGTVNRGFLLTGHDTVILNSDIEVSDFWLDRLLWHAATQPNVGTVTPFSNNATICSFPLIGKDNKRWRDMPVGEISDLFHMANAGLSVDIPTGVGFCMYVSRALLKTVGLFDEERFGLGYGEENDLCCRAAAAGFHNLHALDLYVYHAGRASFDLRDIKAEDNMPKLLEKHPTYLQSVARAFELDLSAPARLRAMLLTALKSSRTTSLFLMHNLGGGTASIANFARSAAEGALIMVMPRKDKKDFELHIRFEGSETFTGVIAREELEQLIRSTALDRIVVHHLYGLDRSVLLALRQTATPVDIVVHDLIWVCPHIFGLRPGGAYCGFPGDTNVCTKCLLFDGEPIGNGGDNALWREHHAAILRIAREVIVASETVADILRRILPGPNYRVSDELWRKWEESLDWQPRTQKPVLDKARPLAVLGVLDERKGRNLVSAVAPHLKRRGIPLTVVGKVVGDDNLHISQTGEYAPEDLPELFNKLNPVAIWISSVAIETFSLTLSEALASGYPVMVNDISILDERAKDHDHTYLLDHNQPPKQVADDLERILSGKVSQLKEVRKPASKSKAVDAEAKTAGAGTVNINRGARLKLGFLVSNHDTTQSLGYRVPDACAYVRLLCHLDHIGERHEVSYFADPNMVTLSDIAASDVFISNRNAIGNEYLLDRIAKFQSVHNTKFVYDIDDQLYEIGAEHPEYDHYQKQALFLTEITKQADQVICSTEPLQHYIAERMNRACAIVRNGVREDWFEKYPHTQKSSKLQIVYYGTNSHLHDWQMIADDVVKFCGRNAAQVEFMLIGILRKHEQPRSWPANMSVLEPPHFATLSYKGFCAWLSNTVAPDIALAPLSSSGFNSFKSEIKVLEAAASSAIPVFSKGFAFDTVAESEPGFGVPVGKGGSWYDALQSLTQASANQWEALESANRAVLDARSLDQRTKEFCKLIEQLA